MEWKCWVAELLGYLGIVKENRNVLGAYNNVLPELKSDRFVRYKESDNENCAI